MIISFTFTKKNLNLLTLIEKLDEKLNNLCKYNNFHYLSKVKIIRNHLAKDGAYLNDNGYNFVDCINNLFLFQGRTQEFLKAGNILKTRAQYMSISI